MSMTQDRAERIVAGHRQLRRYVLADERVVLATRRHWAKLFEPIVSTALVVVVVGWVVLVLSPRLGDGVGVLWWVAIVALARLGWYVLLWRVEWFVATDKRMLLLTGLITHQVAMMPMIKVTDMRYSRSILGQVLGYGEFLLETAGQDQALRRIAWVDHPDETYRDLCATIFTPTAPRAADPEDGDPDAGTEPPAVHAPPSLPPAGPSPAPPSDAAPLAGPGPSPRAAAPRPAAPTQPLRPSAVERDAPARPAAPARALIVPDDNSGPVWDSSEPSTFVRLGAREAGRHERRDDDGSGGPRT